MKRSRLSLADPKDIRVFAVSTHDRSALTNRSMEIHPCGWLSYGGRPASLFSSCPIDFALVWADKQDPRLRRPIRKFVRHLNGYGLSFRGDLHGIVFTNMDPGLRPASSHVLGLLSRGQISNVLSAFKLFMLGAEEIDPQYIAKMANDKTFFGRHEQAFRCRCNNRSTAEKSS